jgi:hypothetical protein
MNWLMNNWQNVVIAVLAIDVALIPLFPKAGLLVWIKDFLSKLGVKPPNP